MLSEPVHTHFTSWLAYQRAGERPNDPTEEGSNWRGSPGETIFVFLMFRAHPPKIRTYTSVVEAGDADTVVAYSAPEGIYVT